ncbi:MAG: MATE family efflux transporter [Lachnospiraceae bacterium]|nr:MATE family efflux transporter [Lachnospiraceae bacterium]
MEKNLTTGSVLKTVLSFSLPYLLSYFLQTLYGMADLFIIGQFNGVESTTAVSIGSQVMHMLTVMIVGLAMGSTVMIGQAIGAEKKEQASQAIGNTVTLFMVLSVALTVGLLFAVKPIVTVMSTPAEAAVKTVSYLTICFMGIPFITAYNIISSIFRGMGDSKSPMYFIAIACGVNIVLDYLFIGGMGLGPAGAALGTTLSQTISVMVFLFIIRRKKTGITLGVNNFKPYRETMTGLLKIGVPIALQDGFIQIAFIVITIIVNKRGLNDAAAVGIVEKIIGILFLVPSSMLQTVSALCAQNIGAGKHERARLTLGYGCLMTVIWGAAAVAVMQLDAEHFIGLFSDNREVVLMGGEYMRGYVWDSILAGIHFCFSGYFCAYGLSGISFVHNSISILCARIPLSYLASKYFVDTLFPMGLASTVGSGVSAVICVGVFIWMNRRFREIERRQTKGTAKKPIRA